MISYSCFATLMRSFKSLKQVFYQQENNSTSSDGLMDACLYYGSVYPVAKIADCNSVTLETSLVRLQPGSPKIVRLFPTPLYKGSCTGKVGLYMLL